MNTAINGVPEVLTGLWTYRSFLSNPDVTADFDSLEFGRGTIKINEGPMQTFDGLIFGPGWELKLTGSIGYGNPFTVQFQGKGVVGGAEWIYNYVGYFVPNWVNGVNQRPALVGTIVRVIPHPTGANGDSTAPAGVVAQWIAVKQDED
ncbi:conserved hypothetical protein [Flavobacterium sp. 9AF]|uniref:hypothetical protein n=1 Tax=Flavobacterium sp. 9AF TaxID=2653142 RepID=UPI0012F38B58|nr:hypothetical protein [Flavobacterium sp. 9AF]VXA99122.1 conserved hypothetical protein [Flavobacterium sp. 9AF]